MTENYTDPSGNTQAFRAFANTVDPPAESSSRTSLIVGVAVAVLLIALAGWFAFG